MAAMKIDESVKLAIFAIFHLLVVNQKAYVDIPIITAVYRYSKKHVFCNMNFQVKNKLPLLDRKFLLYYQFSQLDKVIKLHKTRIAVFNLPGGKGSNARFTAPFIPLYIYLI